MNSPTLRRILPFIAMALVVVVAPLVVKGHYLQSVGVLVGIYSLIVLGLCLLMGYAGQASLGHAAFYGLGAYTSAILTTKAHLNPWLGLVAGVVVACSVAWFVGRPALRLQGHYLAMATLGFGIIVQIIFHEAEGLTGGFGGITSIPAFKLGALEIKGDLLNLYLVWTVLLFALALATNIMDSRIGRALRAIHDSEEAACACGVDVTRTKLQVFVLSAGLAAVAGSLYAHYVGFISPDPFGMHFSVQLVVMVIVGGSRSIWGAVLGAALMTALGQQIDKTEAIKDLSTVVYGGMLMVFVIFMPGGLVELLRQVKFGRRRRSQGVEAHG